MKFAMQEPCNCGCFSDETAEPPGSVGHGQLSTDDGKPKVEKNNDQHTQSPHPKPKPSSADTSNMVPVNELFGKELDVANAVPGGQAFMFIAKNANQLMPVTSGWEKVTLIVDSGASDTVVPPTVCKAALLRHTSRVGITYEVADGGEARNLGERVCEVKTDEASQGGMQMSFQVVDKLTKALLSVHKVCAQGHDVVFSEKKGNYSLVGGQPDARIPLRAVGGTYELDVWLRPSDGGDGSGKAGFARPEPSR